MRSYFDYENEIIKKALLFLAVVLIPALAAGYTLKKIGGPGASADFKVGVSMPTRALQRWNQDGENLRRQLLAAGYGVDLQYAGNNEIPVQVSQIENMITSGCNAQVIAAIDGSSLTEVLKSAKEKGVPVISYDRLIMNSDAVTYYTTFDNYKAGVIQGQYIESKLGLKDAAGPFNIELVTGAPDDNNVCFFFNGAMSVLEPYILSGKLRVPSGQITRDQAATPNWSNEEAQRRFENLIVSNGYGPDGRKLNAVLASNDSVANGVTNALVRAGYTRDNIPVITGQDCDKPSVKNMKAGIQSMSVFKDIRTLAAHTVKMVDALARGTQPEVNDTGTYNNGTGVIPSFLCPLVVVEPGDIRSVLIESGYYKAADIE